MKKKYITYLLAVVFMLALAAFAFAAPEGGGYATDQSSEVSGYNNESTGQPAAVTEETAEPGDSAAVATKEVADTSEHSAEAEAGEHETEEHGSMLKGFIYQVINFAIIAGLLWYFARKPISDALKNRTATIQQKIEEARAAREKAEKALAEVNQRLQSKDREIEELVAASVKAGEKERERLIAEGERMAENLIEQARKNIELELDQARASIKAEAVELAMEMAEKSIKDKMGASEQKRLFEEALGKLEGKV